MSEIGKKIAKFVKSIAEKDQVRSDVVVGERNGIPISQSIIKSDMDSKFSGAVYLLETLATRKARGDAIDDDELNIALTRYQQETGCETQHAKNYFDLYYHHVRNLDKK